MRLTTLFPDVSDVKPRFDSEKDPFGNPLCFVDETTLFTGHPK